MTAPRLMCIAKRIGMTLSIVILLIVCVTQVGAERGGSLTWQVRPLSDGNEYANLPTVAADAAGAVHIVWIQGKKVAQGEVFYYAYTDGQTWFSNDVIAEAGHGPSLVVDKDEKLHLVWAGQNAVRYSQATIATARTASGWSPPRSIAEGSIYLPFLLYDPRHILHLVYADYAEAATSVYYMQSLDGGGTWSPRIGFDAVGGDGAVDRPRLALGPDGVLHMVWSLVPTTNYYGGLGVYYAHSINAGKSWSQPIRIDAKDADSMGKGAWLANIGVTMSGTLVVVWDASLEAGRRHYQWSSDGGKTWTDPEPVWPNFVSQTGVNPMLSDSSGTLYLFAGGAPNWDRQQGVVMSQWTGSGWTPYQMVDDTSSFEPHYIQTTITAGNRIHLVWDAPRTRGTPHVGWYATTQTSAPELPVRPYQPQATLTPSPTIGPTSAPTIPPLRQHKVQNGAMIPERNAVLNPEQGVWLGVLPVIVLLVAIILTQVLGGHR